MILFGCWSPSEDVFWNDWITAGICTAPNVFASAYAGQVEVSTSWSGIVTKPTGVDAEGNPILTPVPGWHCNVRIGDALAETFTAGLPQTDADGRLLSIWQRTRAAQVFGLTDQPADPTTGFPAGMRNMSGVTYADASSFKSPSNVWA